MLTFSKLKNRYQLVCEFSAVGAWHIGSGSTDASTDAPILKRGGKPFIPGSSLRGALRSAVERVARSLPITAFNNVCTLWEEVDTGCVASVKSSRERFEGENAVEEFAKLRRGEDGYRLCAVCQLFGSTVMAAKLRVGDAELASDGNLPPQCSIRDGVGINRDTGTAQDKLKFDYEVVEGGGRFQTVLLLENGCISDFALLHILIEEWRIGIELGGRKARGLGRMQLESVCASYFDEDRGHGLLHYLCNGFIVEDNLRFRGFLKAKFVALTSGQEG